MTTFQLSIFLRLHLHLQLLLTKPLHCSKPERNSTGPPTQPTKSKPSMTPYKPAVTSATPLDDPVPFPNPSSQLPNLQWQHTIRRSLRVLHLYETMLAAAASTPLASSITPPAPAPSLAWTTQLTMTPVHPDGIVTTMRNIPPSGPRLQRCQSKETTCIPHSSQFADCTPVRDGVSIPSAPPTTTRSLSETPPSTRTLSPPLYHT